MKFENFQIDPEFNQEIKDTYESFYNEIWHEHEYDRFGVTISPGDTVVDFGGSIGLFAQYAVHNGAEKVYTFEFQDKIYEYMRKNVENEPKIVATHGFIGPAFFNSHDYQDYPTFSPDIEIWTIEKVMETFQLETIDFLKVDIEGGEFDLIDATPVEILSRVKKISMEVHVWQMFEYVGDPGIAAYNAQKFLNMMEKLNLCGFKVSIQKIHRHTCLYMLYASR
jgi:FkbM family methyltransferase